MGTIELSSSVTKEPGKNGTQERRRPQNFIRLQTKIQARELNVGVIGLGYVGLPLATAFAEARYNVYGCDLDPHKVTMLNKGVSYIGDVPSADVKKYREQKKITASTDFEALKDSEVIVICVPTPLSKTKDPDLSYINSACESIEKHLVQGQLIILESTTYPGTTREVLIPRLEAAGEKLYGKFKCGEDFFLAFSPERVDPGNAKFGVKNTPKVIGGVTPECSELGATFYANVVDRVVQVSSPASAEMVKILENTFRAVNIGLVNEVAIMCEKLSVDVWEVIEAASTKPFGFMPFYPGPGLGGHCIPIDPSYLSWRLRALNYTARFIELANNVNSSMPEFCVQKIGQILNGDRRSINGSKILLLGVAYKKDVDDMRESPALEIMQLLRKQGAAVDYFDPHVKEIKEHGFSERGIEWSSENIRKYDLCVITTDHTAVNYAQLVDQAAQIFDTRNALKTYRDSKIHRL